jgi:hypothetical protein
MSATDRARAAREENRACHPQRRSGISRCCVSVDTPIKRPDLATYSQAEQLSKGVAPTWDSPDIVSCLLPVNALLPECSVTVRNLSPSCSAVNALVSLFISPFGLGMPRTLEGQMTVSLGPLAQSTILFPLSQAALKTVPQAIGANVSIQLSQDANLINNNGGQNLMGLSTLVSGRVITVQIAVRNPASYAQLISLDAMPNSLSANIQSNVGIGALSQAMVPMILEVPAAAHGTPAAPMRLDATVVARGNDGSLMDGITYAVFVED